MQNDLNKLKSSVKELESANDDGSKVSAIFVPSESKTDAERAIVALKELAERKMAEGFILVRTPCPKGYTEKWVKK